MWEDVERSEISKISNDISRYITNEEEMIIVIKKVNKMKTFKMYSKEIKISQAVYGHFNEEYAEADDIENLNSVVNDNEELYEKLVADALIVNKMGYTQH